jgi:hypothetical protein
MDTANILKKNPASRFSARGFALSGLSIRVRRNISGSQGSIALKEGQKDGSFSRMSRHEDFCDSAGAGGSPAGTPGDPPDGPAFPNTKPVPAPRRVSLFNPSLKNFFIPLLSKPIFP